MSSTDPSTSVSFDSSPLPAAPAAPSSSLPLSTSPPTSAITSAPPTSVPPLLQRLVSLSSELRTFATELRAQWSLHGDSHPLVLKSFSKREIYSDSEVAAFHSLLTNLKLLSFFVQNPNHTDTDTEDQESSSASPFELLLESLQFVTELQHGISEPDSVGDGTPSVSVETKLNQIRRWNSLIHKINSFSQIETKIENELWVSQGFRLRLSQVQRVVFLTTGRSINRSNTKQSGGTSTTGNVLHFSRLSEDFEQQEQKESISVIDDGSGGSLDNRPVTDFIASWEKKKEMIDGAMMQIEEGISVGIQVQKERQLADSSSSSSSEISDWLKSAQEKLARFLERTNQEAVFWDCVIHLVRMAEDCFVEPEEEEQQTEEESEGETEVDSAPTKGEVDLVADFFKKVPKFDEEVDFAKDRLDRIVEVIAEVKKFHEQFRTEKGEEAFSKSASFVAALNRSLEERKVVLDARHKEKTALRLEFEKEFYVETPERIVELLDSKKPDIGIEETNFTYMIMYLKVLVTGFNRRNDEKGMRDIKNLSETAQAHHEPLVKEVDALVERTQKFLALTLKFRRRSEEKEVRDARKIGKVKIEEILARVTGLRERLESYCEMVRTLNMEGEDGLFGAEGWLRKKILSIEVFSGFEEARDMEAAYLAVSDLFKIQEPSEGDGDATTRDAPAPAGGETGQFLYNGYRRLRLDEELFATILEGGQRAWNFRVKAGIIGVRLSILVAELSRLRSSIPRSWASDFYHAVAQGLTERYSQASRWRETDVMLEFVGAFEFPTKKKKRGLFARRRVAVPPSVHIGQFQFLPDDTRGYQFKTADFVSGHFVRMGPGVWFNPPHEPESDFFGQFDNDRLEGAVRIFDSKSGQLRAVALFRDGAEISREMIDTPDTPN